MEHDKPRKPPRTRRARLDFERLVDMRASRRAFLRGAGGAVLGLPLLELTTPRRASAQQATRRLLILSMGHSMDVDGGYDSANFDPSHSAGTLTALSPILEPAAAHMGKLSFLRGLDNLVAQALSSNGHNASGRTVLAYQPHHAANFNADGSLAANQDGYPINQIHDPPPSMYPIGPSINYYVAERMGVAPLNLRVGGDHGEHARDFYESTDSQGQTIIQRDPCGPDPAQAFDGLFGSVGAPGPQLSPLERLRRKRGSVLDGVLTSFNRLIGEVGATDRMRLERHADHIRQIESEATRTVQIVCDNPTLNLPPGLPTNLADGNGRSDDLITAAQLGVIGTAFACQATNVAHLHFSNIQVNKFPFLNGGADMFESGDAALNWHGAVHHDDGDAPEAVQRRLTVMRWYAKLLADTIELLEGLPEGAGSVMDSTLVVWISSLRYSSHGTDSLPVVLAGGLGGALTSGRFHDFGSHGSGGTLGDLWASVGNIMLMGNLSNGWTGAPLSGFGFAAGTASDGRSYQNGPLPGLLTSG